MRQIIGGKKYDTETATCLCDYETPLRSSEHRYYTEALYRKTTGEFFLAGEGGPLTHYAEAVGNNCYAYGSHISPLSIEEAKEWAEVHMSVSGYEEVFGPVPE